MAVTIAERIHLFPYRTQKLSSLAPKVLGLTAREDRLLPPSIHGNGLHFEVRFFFCIIKLILQEISVSVFFIKFPHFMFCSCFCVLLHAAGSALFLLQRAQQRLQTGPRSARHDSAVLPYDFLLPMAVFFRT